MPVTSILHLITCEYPPALGGVSEHSRVIAAAAQSSGFEVHVWTTGAGTSGHVDVHPTLQDFSAEAFAKTDERLAGWPAPRRLIVQWVPHGYGRRGLNVAFSHWLRRRADAGDSIDLIVHEPFIDFFGGSWKQPFVAAVQRYMTWTALRAADRVWLTIPGWEPRLRPYGSHKVRAARTLPVPGTIPPVSDPQAVQMLRGKLLEGRSRLVGYFGAGGPYAFDAIRDAAREVSLQDAALVCIGRGSDVMSADLRAEVKSAIVSGTGSVDGEQVSLYLQACDALVQPYPDGVSGRRTTTITALEHGVPVATTLGWLSEDFWKTSEAIEGVSAEAPWDLGTAVLRLLEPHRNRMAKTAAVELYRRHFDPARTLRALLSPVEQAASC